MSSLTISTRDRVNEAVERYNIDADAVCHDALFQAIAGQLPLLKLTPRARMLLHEAEQEASQLGHEYIGTEHLLLALLKQTGGVADHVIRELGLVDTLRTKLLEIIHSAQYNTGSNRVCDQEHNLIGFMCADKEGNRYIGDVDGVPVRHKRNAAGQPRVVDRHGNLTLLDENGRVP